jgi:hypothetical protein
LTARPVPSRRWRATVRRCPEAQFGYLHCASTSRDFVLLLLLATTTANSSIHCGFWPWEKEQEKIYSLYITQEKLKQKREKENEENMASTVVTLSHAGGIFGLLSLLPSLRLDMFD